jgi:Helicase associated domain
MRFVEREGHARVPHGHREDGYPLGQWIEVQRQLHRGSRQGRLEPARRARLEALPRWTWNPRGTRWEDGFVHLERFVERDGHARVPPAYRDEDGFRLGSWVDAQRVYRRQGQDFLPE